MARPRADNEAIRNRIIDIAQTLLSESSGQRLVLSDIAKRMGVSQPYIHRHFKTKHQLLSEIARRWFLEIEKRGQTICESDHDWHCKLQDHILSTLAVKKSAYEADPQLFIAYVNIAAAHKDIVEQHALNLSNQLAKILAEKVPEEKLEPTLNMVLDATVQFRIPSTIASSPQNATPERARRVLDAIIASISNDDLRK